MIHFTTAERGAVLNRFREQLAGPLARRDGEFLIFSNGTSDGFKYPLAKVDIRYPFSDFFDLPWFTEAHGVMAIWFVRAWLDEQVNKRPLPRRKGRGVHFDE